MSKKNAKTEKSGNFFKRHKKLTTALIVIVSIILLFVLICLSTYIPKTGDTDYNSEACLSNPYIVEDTLVSAHRAGRTLAPENTLAAFDACLNNGGEYEVDILEFDLHLTKDEDLILLHDDTLDRTSDCANYGEKNVKPIDKTVEELKVYNMGYNFEENGEYPYRKEGADLTNCRIVTLTDVFDFLKENGKLDSMRFIIEIKDGKNNGYKAADILADTLKEYGLLDKTVVGTFKGEVSKYLDSDHPEIIRSAGIAEVLGFYFASVLGIKLDNVKYKVLQIPYKDFVLNFGKKSLVDYAHKYGIAVQYWTINKEKDIRHLTKIGADAIISDNPKLAYEVINDVYGR